MKLVDGQVMDYTKDNAAPYRDPRADGPIFEAPAPVVAVQVVPEPSVMDDAMSVRNVVYPGYPYPNEPVERFVQAPSFPSVQVEIHDPLADVSAQLWEKVKARKEALESLEEATPEIRATVRTLEWVLQSITHLRTSL